MEPILYVAAAVAAAKRLHWPAPVLLVLAGLGLALTPRIPRVELAPDLVLLVFLPPLIYTAAFGMSWQAFRANLRPIVLLAIGCVLFTSAAVAAAAHLVAGLSWPVAFLLGAIVSPPDAVAPLAIVRRLGARSGGSDGSGRARRSSPRRGRRSRTWSGWRRRTRWGPSWRRSSGRGTSSASATSSGSATRTATACGRRSRRRPASSRCSRRSAPT